MYYDGNDFYRKSSKSKKSARLRKKRLRRRIKIAAAIIKLCLMAAVAVGLIFVICHSNEIFNRNQNEEQKMMESDTSTLDNQTSEPKVSEVSGGSNHKLNEIFTNREQYPEEFLELLTRNPETLDFVYNYPNYKNKVFDIDISEDVKSGKVPLYLQWDERWGYASYGDSVIGINGCGPTCLSMVAAYILHDEKMNPKWMAQFSEKNGYFSTSGTLWTLMSKGAEELGMESVEIPLDYNRILNNLEAGNPIICSMAPGDFTTEGHFIVMTGVQNGKIVVNDPNSRERSKKLWEYEEIKNQIKNLWTFRVK